MPRSLVTGGAGFIGSHVVDELIARGHEVGVLDLPDAEWDNCPDGAIVLEADITNPGVAEDAFRVAPWDYIFHLAAYAAEGLSHHIKRYNYEVNLIGSVNLINAAVNAGCVKCFVFTSSAAVYGESAPLPTPIDSYGIAKLAVEQELRITHEHFGLPYVIFRPHNVYGERQNLADRYRNVIGIFMNQAMHGEPFTIFGDGEQRRQFTYIGDIAPLIAEVVDVPQAVNRTLEIGSEVPVSILTVVAMVARAMDVDLTVNHLPARNEATTIATDHSWTRTVFGDIGHTTLHDGLTRMAAWAKTVGPQESSTFEHIEIARNLPPSWAQPSVRS